MHLVYELLKFSPFICHSTLENKFTQSQWKPCFSDLDTFSNVFQACLESLKAVYRLTLHEFASGWSLKHRRRRF